MLQFAEVKITRAVNCSLLYWPASHATRSYPGPGWNREYSNLQGCTWSEAENAFEFENRVLERHFASAVVLDEFEDEDMEIEAAEYLMGLDLGIASSVITLSAARCITFASCNGGVLGGHHHEKYPLVSLFAKRNLVPILLECAETSGAGLENQDGGALQLYADDVRKLMRFTRELLGKKKVFIKPKRANPSSSRMSSNQ